MISIPVALRHDKRGDRECRASLPNNIVGRRHCLGLILVANNSDAAGHDMTSKILRRRSYRVTKKVGLVYLRSTQTPPENGKAIVG